MDVVLIILGVLGFGAIVIAAYVFTVAARNYVSSDTTARPATPPTSRHDDYIERQSHDRRRSTGTAHFPMAVNGVMIVQDRRQIPDRRAAA